MSLGHDVLQLLDDQKREWKALADGYGALDDVRTREIPLEHFTLRLQFNPKRIISSGAKIDPKSIAARPCFLCPANRPKEQRGIEFEDYTLLLNPFPIMPVHLTVPVVRHEPQTIAGKLGTMLRLAKALGHRFTIFYNGPKAGASAPDHFHFQVGNSGFLPIETDYEEHRERFGQEIGTGGSSKLLAIDVPLRPIFAIESKDESEATRLFERLLLAMCETGEPSMNLFAWWLGDTWRIILFPRGKHRPDIYFAEGDAKMLLSPGAVDMAGVIVMPVEKDFDRVTRADLEQMLREVSYSSEMIQSVMARASRP